MNKKEKSIFLNSLSEDEAKQLEYWWPFWARPSQLPPAGWWNTWVMLCGRGSGKTRSSSEWVRSKVESGESHSIALIGKTAADVRDVMVNGESGIIACSPPWFKPRYVSSKRRLEWPNGAYALLFNGTEPDQLRGPQFDLATIDEMMKFDYPEQVWDMLQFGLRLGRHPQCMITTTPRPLKILKQIMADSMTVVTRGSTYENAENLSSSFIHSVKARYEGTRLGRQELNAEILDDTPGALWTREMIEDAYCQDVPNMARVVVAIDPAVSDNEDSDETGIVVAGVDKNGRYYILCDATQTMTSPDKWASAAVLAYDAWGADRIVGEVNNGGAMVGSVLATAARSLYDKGLRNTSTVSYKAVHASRGKITRAEPIAALFEQRRVGMLGTMHKLEDQMCSYVPGSKNDDSPDRLDAMVWAMTELTTGGASVNQERLRV